LTQHAVARCGDESRRVPRKSSEQNVADDLKSVAQQTELARRFAKAKGWTVCRTFEDDAVRRTRSRIDLVSSRCGPRSPRSPARSTS
jgi:hypothetical protein